MLIILPCGIKKKRKNLITKKTLMSNEYWFCIIGPATQDKILLNGADGPLRYAVQKAYEGMLKTTDYTASSGWGVSEIQKEAMELARLYPEKVIKLLKNASI